MTDPLYPLLAVARLRMGTDGKGITTLVAGAGCPLSCRFCINRKLLYAAKPEMVSPRELYNRVKIDNLYFQATGGGITFGGGEALLHAAFISHFRQICPKEWRICAETSLCVPGDLLKMALSSVDEFIVDCKDLDESRFHAYTGGDGRQMSENLIYLLEKAGPGRVHIRVPLIPGYNTLNDRQDSIRILREMGFTRIEPFEYIVK